MVKKSNVLDIM